MAYYDTFSWGITGLGSVASGGDGSLLFAAYNSANGSVVAPSSVYIQENPLSSGNYTLRVPGWTPVEGDFGVISTATGGIGNVITFKPDLPPTSVPTDEEVSISLEDTRIQ